MADNPEQQSTSTSGTGANPTAAYHRTPVVYANRGKLVFKNNHNTIACLNTEAVGIGLCKDVMTFLMRSRIHKAISDETPVYQRHLEDFWCTATVNSVSNPTQIIAKVVDKKIVLTEGILRRVLQFGDDAVDNVVLNKEKVRGCLMRCGYPDLSGVVAKKFLCPHFKYLAHVIIHCLGSKKAGFDTMSEPLQNVFAALIMNMNYNFSRMIWNYLTEAASNKRTEFDFLLYPRFIQMMINDLRPNLAKEGDVLVFNKMDDTSVRYMFNYSERQVRPKDVPFWGALAKVDYLCPPGNMWKNEGSDCEDNVIVVEPSQPKTGKRKGKAVEEAAELLGVEQRTRKKPNLAFKPRPLPTRATQSTSSVPPQPEQPIHSQPTTTETSAHTSSENTDRQISALQSMVISLSNNYTKLMEEMEKLRKEKEEEAAENERMRKELSEAKSMLLTTNERCESLEERVKIMETCYDEQQGKMETDEKGYFRLSGQSKDLPGPGDAGAGPSSHGTDSDSDDTI